LVVGLGGRPATAVGLGLISSPRARTYPWGPRFSTPVLAGFLLAAPPAPVGLTGGTARARPHPAESTSRLLLQPPLPPVKMAHGPLPLPTKLADRHPTPRRLMNHFPPIPRLVRVRPCPHSHPPPSPTAGAHTAAHIADSPSITCPYLRWKMGLPDGYLQESFCPLLLLQTFIRCRNAG
jgi:hypothetical protein